MTKINHFYNGNDANGLAPHGHVYRSMHVLEATRRLVTERPVWDIPAMKREPVRGATHRGALERITEEMGEEWGEHAIDSRGSYIADRQAARSAIKDLVVLGLRCVRLSAMRGLRIPGKG